jgi:hypothetical protein
MRAKYTSFWMEKQENILSGQVRRSGDFLFVYRIFRILSTMNEC